MTTTVDTSIFVFFCGIIAALFSAGAFVLAVRRVENPKRGHLYIVESAFLIAIVLFLAWGTRDTVLKVVDSFQRDKVVFSEDQDTAVLEAYDKLSNELNRWSVMFVALGAFFGLVLPIGAYLLQMKEIARKEGAVDEKFEEEARLRKEESDQAKKEIKELSEKFREDVSRVWVSQVVMANERLRSTVSDFKADGWKLDRRRLREFLSSLLLVLAYLERTQKQDFVVSRMSDLAKLICLLKENVQPEDFKKWVAGMGEQHSATRIALFKYCDDDEESRRSFKTVQTFVREFGLKVLDS